MEAGSILPRAGKDGDIEEISRELEGEDIIKHALREVEEFR